MQPIVKRLDQFLAAKGLNPNKLAELLGYNNPEKLYRLFRQENAKPSIDIIEDISNKFDDLDTYWLLTGKKSPENSARMPPPKSQKRPFSGQKMPISPPPSEGFVTDSVTNPSQKGENGRNSGRSLAGKSESYNENSESDRGKNCSKCEAKDEIIAAMKGQLSALQNLLETKERMITMIERENARLERDETKQQRDVG